MCPSVRGCRRQRHLGMLTCLRRLGLLLDKGVVGLAVSRRAQLPALAHQARGALGPLRASGPAHVAGGRIPTPL